jgi:hypothetical protein
MKKFGSLEAGALTFEASPPLLPFLKVKMLAIICLICFFKRFLISIESVLFSDITISTKSLADLNSSTFSST